MGGFGAVGLKTGGATGGPPAEGGRTGADGATLLAPGAGGDATGAGGRGKEGGAGGMAPIGLGGRPPGRRPGAPGGFNTGGFNKPESLADSFFGASSVAGRDGKLMRTVSFLAGAGADSDTAGRVGSVMRTVSFFGSLSLIPAGSKIRGAYSFVRGVNLELAPPAKSCQWDCPPRRNFPGPQEFIAGSIPLPLPPGQPRAPSNHKPARHPRGHR